MKTKKEIVGVCVLFFVLLLFTGCATDIRITWIYTPSPVVQRQPLLNKTVAVLPFEDVRGNNNTNAMPLYTLPVILPGGWQDMDKPEAFSTHICDFVAGRGGWTFRPDEDIAKAVAQELANSHLFKDAFFTFRESEGELQLRGKILSTHYGTFMCSYFAGVFGPILWIFGFPAVYSVNNDLELELSLVEVGTANCLWRNTYREEYNVGVGWLYAMPSGFEYPALLKNIMLKALPDIEQALRPKP